jgi:hypothetical protein
LMKLDLIKVDSMMQHFDLIKFLPFI